MGALVDTEGHTTNYYKNEATYQLSTKTTEIADQLKTTSSNFSQQFSHWKRSPFLLGMSTMHNNNTTTTNNNNNKNTGSNNITHHEQQQRQQQDEQQAHKKNQSVKVATTNNNQEPEQRSSAATTTTTKKYQLGGSILPSSFPFPTLLPKSLLSKEQPQLSTTYGDRNRNEHTLVEENRRQASHTRMN